METNRFNAVASACIWVEWVPVVKELAEQKMVSVCVHAYKSLLLGYIMIIITFGQFKLKSST